MCSSISEGDPYKQLEAVACIAKLLSIVEVFPTPQERRAVVSTHSLHTLHCAVYSLQYNYRQMM